MGVMKSEMYEVKGFKALPDRSICESFLAEETWDFHVLKNAEDNFVF